MLGTGIALLMQRDPIHTAKEVTSLDLISGGRAVLGVGAGWNREEMRNHGTDPGTRGQLLDERLAAIKEIWISEAAEFHGKFVDFDPIASWPKPVQRPHPPIFVGAAGDAGHGVRRWPQARGARGVPRGRCGACDVVPTTELEDDTLRRLDELAGPSSDFR